MSLAAWARMGRDAGGLDWYPAASAAVVELARAHGADPGYTCDVLAVLSPRVRVERNVWLAARALAGTPPEELPTLPSVRVSLRRYLDTGAIAGPKVRAFALALRGDPSAVVVDTWVVKALQAATGRPYVATLAGYPASAEAVRRLARRLGGGIWTPRDTQACLWVGYQLSLGRRPGSIVVPQTIGGESCS